MEASSRPYCLARNEEVILSSPGLYKDRLRSGWKLGRYYLTNERLFLFQPPKIVFQVPYEDIIGITTERRAVVLRTKEVIFLTYRSNTRNRISEMLHRSDQSPKDNAILNAWIAVGNIEAWRKKIYERSLVRIDEDGINMVMEQLDSESREILLYIWKKGHANIDELSSLYEAPNHMDILFKIREVINPTAERLLGYSLLTFERSRKNDSTGKIITYNWWIIGKKEAKEEIKEPIVDIFDEGNCLSVIMELLDAGEENIQVEVARNKLSISSNNNAKLFNHQIPLPCEVKAEGLTKRYNNSILEITAQKA